MALKPGFCTHCDGDEKLRIFNVNKDAEVCYCPHCTAPMLPKDAILNYRNLIAHYLKKASRYLFETTEYLRAYQTFAHIIELDDSIKVAYFGRILALVHLSTLRKGKIYFAHLMHRQQASKLFHYRETANEYYHFVVLLLDAIDQYESKIKKRLTSHGVFYDVDCVTLYLKRLEENRAYKEFLLTEAEFFAESNKDQFRNIVERIQNDKAHYEKAFKDPYLTADGTTYSLTDFGSNGNPILSEQIKEDVPKVRHIKDAIALYPKDNKKSPIRDAVYANNLPIFIFVTASVPLAIILFLVALGAMITGLVVDVDVAKIILLISAAVVTSVSLMLLILHFAWKNALKKKYYNGTNPFILK
ncbi:MAG: hypothetical protein J6X50_04325 [Bacilli bacterium]|nr:hypothetical protein [Bacilli bacterium]